MHDQIPKTPIRFTWFATKPYLILAMSVVFFATVAQFIQNSTPYIFKKVIDNAELVATGGAEVSTVILWGMLYPVAISLMFLTRRVGNYLGVHWETKSGAYAYRKLFEHLTLHSDTFFSNNFSGALASRITRGAGNAQGMVDQLIWNWYGLVLQTIITIFLITITNIWIGVIFTILILVLVILNIRLSKWRRPYVVAYSKIESELSGQAVDVTTNMRAVHQYARRSYEINEIGKTIEKRRGADAKQMNMSTLIMVINNIFIAISLFITVYLTISLWSKNVITTGDLVMVLTLFAGMIGSLTGIGNMMNRFIRRYGEMQEALERILEPHDLLDKDGAKKLMIDRGNIEFQDVNFHYQEKEGRELVFENFDLNIIGHQKIGLVGQSGAGKTTFVNLLLRQFDVSNGQILVDGQDITEIKQESLRSNIAIVPQEPLLFHRSIKENIRYGNPDATDEEVTHAAKLAQAHDFIIAAPDGYNTFVGERGIKLSGGQRQRVAIARAILKNAPILLLDEATSSLDSESEVLIQKALHELMQGKTVIAVAHRLSTLREMDRIVVLEEGKLVQDGTHSELSQQDGVYKRLWDHQVGGFLQEE